MSKILIVEDDPLISRVYQRVFTFEGFDVEMAADGEEGLTKAKSAHPTIILLDIMMPKMNGLEVLAQLKADPVMAAIPVIMLTNLSGQDDTQKALSGGAIKYIVKSEYDPKEVSDMVKQVLASAPRSDTAATPPLPVNDPPPAPPNQV
jgi:DNA-binding response OmpR family regulator